MNYFSKIVLAGATTVVAATSVSFAKEPTWVTDKPLELKLHMHFSDRYVWDESWPVAKESFRLTNVKMINTANKAATKSSEQFSLMMASGELPDIVGGNNLKDNFIRYGIEGAFIPLNKLIDQHAPNFKAFLKSHPDVAASIRAPDGNYYFVPYIPDGVAARGWFIRQDWLDKLKLKQPTTVAELYTVLKAFKDKDPNGNGKADEVPYFSRDPNEVFRLVNLWGARASGSNQTMDFYVDGGKVKHPFAEPAFRDAIKNVAKWYNEGLIDKEIFTRKARAREQLLGGNVGGSTHDWFATTASFNDTLQKTIPGFKFAVMPPAADSTGKRWEEDSRLPVRPDGWAITINNKNPVETIKFFDFYFGRKGRNLANFGIEGTHFDIKNGKAIFKESVLNDKQSVLNQMKAVGAQIPIGFWQDYEYERQFTNPLAQAGIDMYEKNKYIIPSFLGVSLNPEERAVYDQRWPDILTYMSEMGQNWVMGTKDPVATWPEYQARLKSLGYFQVMALMQNAYNRVQAKK